MKAKNKRAIRMTRTANGLLTVLYDELDSFLSGKASRKHALTVSRLSNSIIKALPYSKEKAE